MEGWRWLRSGWPVTILLTALLGVAVAVLVMRGTTVWRGGDPQVFQLEGPRVDCAVVAEALALEPEALDVLGGDVSCEGSDEGVGISFWTAVGSQARLGVQKGQGNNPSIGTGTHRDLEDWEESRKGSAVVELVSGVDALVAWSSGPGEGWDVLDRWVWQNSRIDWITETDASWLSVDLTISSPDPRDAVSMANQLLTGESQS